MPNADLKKFLPNRMIEVVGKNLPAIISSFNQGADAVEQTIQACIDQLFITTASGKYLLSLGEEGGFAIPPSAGLDITAFRVLVPIMVSNPKQVRISIQDLVQAFYGSERTKANIISSVFGPFSLSDGDDLLVETESGSFAVNILSSQVSDINNVSATEISSILNYSQSLVSAETYVDRNTGLEALRLLSKTSGTGSYIRVTGGKIQNVLQFPKLAPTDMVSGQTFTITKTFSSSDLLTFTWDGLLTNPLLYNVKTNDVLTIRGLVDGVEAFSSLNGSYTIIDSGYDYFVIRNTSYTPISSSLVIPSDNSLVFTKQDKTILFDKPEFAFLSETSAQTITVTVPAVPPLAVRFLQGSSHLHGSVLKILDFTRSTITVELPEGIDKPLDDNQIVISSKYLRPDFKKKKFQTFISNTNANPTYQILTDDEELAVFPYTVSTVIGSNKINGQVDSNQFIISFDEPHGLYNTWGFNLLVASGEGNISTIDLNKEHITAKVIDDKTLAITLRDSLGMPKNFSGAAIGTPDVYRHTVTQSDGSDFYLEYASSAALIASGFYPGAVFKLDPSAGFDVIPAIANTLKYRKFSVSSIINTGSVHQVNFETGFGPSPSGLIITAAEGFRSANFGGSVSYYTNLASTYNQKNILDTMNANFIGYTPSSNPDYVGSFVYDPSGEQTSVTVSKYIAPLSDNVLRGSAVNSLFVDSLTVNGDFPSSGKMVISYGTSNFEGPINYYSTISSGGINQIVIDPAYKFKLSHDVGESVQYIHTTAPYTPDKFGSAYPAYLTGTTQSREAMFSMIKVLVAAGIFIEKDIIFPDLRYDDDSLLPFE